MASEIPDLRVRTFPRESALLGRDTVRALMYYALKVWSDIAPLNFHEVAGSDADIQVDFTKADHDDGYPFDGPGGTVAHAFFPGERFTAGDTHFDDDEAWTFRSPAPATERGERISFQELTFQQQLMNPPPPIPPMFSPAVTFLGCVGHPLHHPQVHRVPVSEGISQPDYTQLVSRCWVPVSEGISQPDYTQLVSQCWGEAEGEEVEVEVQGGGGGAGERRRERRWRCREEVEVQGTGGGGAGERRRERRWRCWGEAEGEEVEVQGRGGGGAGEMWRERRWRCRGEAEGEEVEVLGRGERRRERRWRCRGEAEGEEVEVQGEAEGEEVEVQGEEAEGWAREDMPRMSEHKKECEEKRGLVSGWRVMPQTGKYFWRLTRERHLVSLRPAQIHRFWRGLPAHLEGLDAV
ncbi:hypothetical protein CRUP_035445 [Coryphaenoides rupestris]|nr:hypothetical protein CRUP_035445 [Coryphaenoides rupestris]